MTTAMRQHFEWMHSMMPENKMASFMLLHGHDYIVGPDTFAGPREAAKLCYMNATHLAQRNRALTYVEGKVNVYGVPIDHAWCVDAEGGVVDPTLDRGMTDGTFDRISDYFGVPFHTDYVVKACLANGVYGLLDFVTARATLPKLVELGLEAGQQWLLDQPVRSRLRRKAVR